MPSPFPGMNPYLEHPHVWHDFHQTMMPAMREAIRSKAPPGYVVLLEEQVFVEVANGGTNRVSARPDVAVVSQRHEPNGGLAIMEAPTEVELVETDRIVESYIEIRNRESWELVAAIELLSPSNKKPGRDRDLYEAKRLHFFASAAHFVEIDLLRGWGRMPMKHVPPCDYGILVSRAELRPRSGFWPVGLREPLPAVPIPLSAGHADIPLDLQTVLHRVYDSAGYGSYIYENSLEPPLSDADAPWAKEILAFNT